MTTSDDTLSSPALFTTIVSTCILQFVTTIFGARFPVCLKALNSKQSSFAFCALFLFLASSTVSTAAPPSFKVEPAVVEPGQSCVLTWTSDGDGAFILNHGHVKPSGSLELKPDYSTTYTLVVEKNGVVEMATASVDIKGQRGSPLIPSRDDFKFSFKGRETILKYEDFLPVIEDVLQTNHFEFIGTFKKSDPYVVYYTDHSERNDLRGKDEHGRNAHRLSYCVQVNKPTADDPKEVKFTVFALVELRPVAESDWSASEDGELVRTRAEDLCKQISSAAEKPPK